MITLVIRPSFTQTKLFCFRNDPLITNYPVCNHPAGFCSSSVHKTEEVLMPFVLEVGVCQQTDPSPHQKEREKGWCLSCQQTNIPLEGVRVATDAAT